ncbi:Putative AC transposase [Linum perenne]
MEGANNDPNTQPQPLSAHNQPPHQPIPNLAEPANPENQPQPAAIVGDENVDQSRLTSDVWAHCSRVRVNGVMKAKCKYCRKLLSGESNSGTSNIRNHIRTCIRKKIHDGQQKVLGSNFISKGKAKLVAIEYNYEVAKKMLCSMILIHEYPLSIVDHLGFQRFCCALQPLFKVPCRNTIKKDILTLYELTKNKFQREIIGNRGRVAVTTDMWTATNQKRGYMAITAHYIDNSWNLRSILVRFLYVPAPHTSARLANRLCKSLLEWNIDSKLSAITLDNCTTNDSMVSLLRNKLVPSNLLMDGSLLHMSSCGRLLDPHRNRLHYSTVEAMMCARSWVKDEISREPETKPSDLEGLFSAMAVEEKPEDKVPWPAMEPQL